jgi:hypothetical protein
MQVPFPALKLLKLELADKSVPAPVLPNTFLGESVPRLQRLTLSGIPFPTLPKVLQSSHDLVEIRLIRIPNTGYVSPKSIASALSTMAKLEVLDIGFESPASRADRHPLPSTRIVLPSLTQLDFHGASEYFEDLIARIDTPSVRFVKTEFFNQLFFFIPQFLQFVDRTKSLRSFKRADLALDKRMAKILHYGDSLDSPKKSASEAHLQIQILCDALDWQVSSLAQVCAELSMFLSNVDRCNMKWTEHWPEDNRTQWLEDMDHTEWLELFRPFTSVWGLEISSNLQMLIVPALQELIGERVMEVLPALRTLSVLISDRSFPLKIDRDRRNERKDRKDRKEHPLHQFITARQLSNHPVYLKLGSVDPMF